MPADGDKKPLRSNSNRYMDGPSAVCSRRFALSIPFHFFITCRRVFVLPHRSRARVRPPSGISTPLPVGVLASPTHTRLTVLRSTKTCPNRRDVCDRRVHGHISSLRRHRLFSGVRPPQPPGSATRLRQDASTRDTRLGSLCMRDGGARTEGLQWSLPYV